MLALIIALNGMIIPFSQAAARYRNSEAIPSTSDSESSEGSKEFSSNDSEEVHNYKLQPRKTIKRTKSNQDRNPKRKRTDDPLINATLNDDYNTVKILLDEGHDINVTDERGKTAVVLAIENNFGGLVILFLNHKSMNKLSSKNLENIKQAINRLDPFNLRDRDLDLNSVTI